MVFSLRICICTHDPGLVRALRKQIVRRIRIAIGRRASEHLSASLAVEVTEVAVECSSRELEGVQGVVDAGRLESVSIGHVDRHLGGNSSFRDLVGGPVPKRGSKIVGSFNILGAVTLRILPG